MTRSKKNPAQPELKRPGELFLNAPDRPGLVLLGWLARCRIGRVWWGRAGLVVMGRTRNRIGTDPSSIAGTGGTEERRHYLSFQQI